MEKVRDNHRGFHVHRCGDLSQGCQSLCEHFNPDGFSHGDLNAPDAHAGDLGNLPVGMDGALKDYEFVSNKLRLTGAMHNILGRSLVIHQDRDDLGKGGFPDSALTGHSGTRVLCGVIGLSEEKPVGA